ncbi:regulatory protein GemA [Methylobrevis pamukkalensis]|uniref:Mu-like prophage protein gp16 n=1 Tax=Methylobrevis pamukkalensis TaxID=1439726 RepID=A0A1E3H6S2_9HYPH|nr:regulatory protein GemA [Methylobrevis pamukkalensis]ODN71201.1 hypothetical protein A6302_01490 [Methylobrevis pamukkalensis]
MTAPVMLRAIHAAARTAGLDEDGRHDLIGQITGGRTRSTRDLTPAEAKRVLDQLNSGPRRLLDGPYVPVCRALWISAYWLGVVDDRTDEALTAFVKRQTKIDHVTWVRDQHDATAVIQALKAMMAREAGVEWPKSDKSAEASKRAVIAAQLRLLGTHGGLPDTDDLDARIATLGRRVRKMRRVAR